jgi:hypothetical protein
MKQKAVFFIAFIATVIIGWGTPVLGGASPVTGQPDDIARLILTYFPKVSGSIFKVEGDRVFFKFSPENGMSNGISQGLLFTIFQEGEPFFHPVTKVPIGRHEQEIGVVEINSVAADGVTGTIIHANRQIQIGDPLRTSAARIPVAIAQANRDRPSFMIGELFSALKETGRFKLDLMPPLSTLKEAQQRHNHYLIIIATMSEEGSPVTNVQMKNTLTGGILLEMDFKISPSDQSDLILEQLQHKLLEQRGFH